MKYIFFLSGDYIDLGREEIVSLFDVDEYRFIGRLGVIDLNNGKSLHRAFQRLALTKSVYKFTFECKVNDLIKTMKRFDWNSVYEDDFCLRIVHFKKNQTTSKSNGVGNNPFVDFSEEELAGHIWRNLRNPKVNLENPKTLIEIFIINDKAYCGRLIFQNNENFEERKSHLRPFPHPSSLHPKVARALVNITGIKEDEILLDPFCGTGGFLIEAGLMNAKTHGYDINKEMIDGCIENLKNFKIEDFKIFQKNALKIFHRFDYLVTDLPYGLNSNVMLKYDKDWKKYRLNKKINAKNFEAKLEIFYSKFLKNLRKKLRKKAIIVFPDYVNYKKLLKQSKFKIEKEFENYVHRSLTRRIVKVR